MLMLKNYKQIPEYEDYYINSCGSSVLKLCNSDLFRVENNKVYRYKYKTWVEEIHQEMYFIYEGQVYKKISITTNNAGYNHIKVINKFNTRNLYVHVAVYMTFIGVIPDNLEINHIDHNRTNNNCDNLELVTHSENIFKSLKYRGKRLRKRCKQCGKLYKIEKSDVCYDCMPVKLNGKRERTYNEKLYDFRRRVVERPNKEELLSLIKNNTFRQVSKMYDVSENTIRKWCKSYGLPHRKSDLK